jgi:hypothetical protein
MENPLIQLIDKGRIRTLEELKATYHKLVMKTHPDAVGSDKLIGKYLELSGHYDEAKRYLGTSSNQQTEPDVNEAYNHRLTFYEQLQQLKRLRRHMPITREKMLIGFLLPNSKLFCPLLPGTREW